MTVHRLFAGCTHQGLLALLLSLVLSGSALAAGQVPEIEYAVPDQSVWTTRRDAQGGPDNPLFRVAAPLFAKVGIPWHGKSYPTIRMLKYLQEGHAQFSILVKTPALESCCLFSQKPVTAAELRVYRLADRSPINKRDDLQGKRVITVAGYGYGGLLAYLNDAQNRIDSQSAPTHTAAFRMLANGRADYVLDYRGPAAEVLAEEPIAGIRSELLSRQEVFLVLSRQYPDAVGLMSRLEAALARLDVDKILHASSR